MDTPGLAAAPLAAAAAWEPAAGGWPGALLPGLPPGQLASLLPGLFLAAALALAWRAAHSGRRTGWIGLLALCGLEFAAACWLPPPPAAAQLLLPLAGAALLVRVAPDLPGRWLLALAASYLLNLPALLLAAGVSGLADAAPASWLAGLAVRAVACLGAALAASQRQGGAAGAGPQTTLAEDDWPAALEAHRQAASLLAHELRAPLATLDTAAQTLAMMASDEDQGAQGRAARMRRAVRRVAELTDNFLGSGQLGERLLQPRRERHDLAALARAVAGQMQADMAHPLDIDASGTALAWCDDALVAETVRNLLHNASKYSPANQAITLRWGLDRSGQAWLSVKDGGPGIATEELARIFEPYYRRSLHQETKGMGVGLYLAREMCRRQKGDLQVESRDGFGSVFTIRLPGAPADAPANAPASQAAKT